MDYSNITQYHISFVVTEKGYRNSYIHIRNGQ